MNEKNWKLKYDGVNVKHFGYDGPDEMYLVAFRYPGGEWMWSGDHNYMGNYWPMTQEEIDIYVPLVSRIFQSVL